MKILIHPMKELGPLLLFGLAAGCSTPMKTVQITSTPPEASLTINGRPGGSTPYNSVLTFKDGVSYDVVASKPGFRSAQTTVRYEPREQTTYSLQLEKIEEVQVPLVSLESQKTASGAKMEYLERQVLAYLEVIERSPNVASVTRVTSNEDPNSQVGAAVLSPTDELLVFAQIFRETNGIGATNYYSNLQKMNVGSQAKTRVTYGKWNDVTPAFAPDGKNLIFSSNRTGNNKTLWRIRADGPGGNTKITLTQAEDFSPSVSADGKFIAYASFPPQAEDSQIWTVPMDGNLVTQLREGESPCVSPDSKRILFVRQDKLAKDREIWVMSVDGTEETQLTQNPDIADKSTPPKPEDVIQNIDPRWSPDGKWIVYASNEGRDSKGRRNFDIWMMAADGSKKTQLTTNGSLDDSPCWDRTGKYIYFRSNRGGDWNIWRFEPLIEKK